MAAQSLAHRQDLTGSVGRLQTPTSGSGGGGGVPSTFSRIHLPGRLATCGPDMTSA